MCELAKWACFSAYDNQYICRSQRRYWLTELNTVDSRNHSTYFCYSRIPLKRIRQKWIAAYGRYEFWVSGPLTSWNQLPFLQKPLNRDVCLTVRLFTVNSVQDLYTKCMVTVKIPAFSSHLSFSNWITSIFLRQPKKERKQGQHLTVACGCLDHRTKRLRD